jgi:hypothetical protein
MRNVAALAAHFCFLGIGVAAIMWVIAFAPDAWKYAPLEGVASQVIRGEPIPDTAIEKYIPTMDSLLQAKTCWPKAMHNAAILRGRLVQVAIENSDPRQFDIYTADANTMFRKSLACAPSDSFLWFALFWIENLQNGFQNGSIKYLEKSYDLGPYEGWIALRRNPYALNLYQSLPAELQKRIVVEFAAIVNSGFILDAALTLQGPGWPIRDVLVGSLSDVQEKYKRQLATRLRRLGLEVTIPGIDMPEFRPWQVD